MPLRPTTALLVLALLCDLPCYGLDARVRRWGCRFALATVGAAVFGFGARFYLAELEADTRERNDLQDAYVERADIRAVQERHDRARWQLYETGDPLPMFLLIHELQSRDALARGETPIGFGIGLDRAAVERLIPALKLPRNNAVEIVRDLAARMYGMPLAEPALPKYPRTASSFLAGHNLLNAMTREKLVVVAGIANEFGIPARLRVGWKKGASRAGSFVGDRLWVEFPTLGVCVDPEVSREPVALRRYLDEYVSFYLDDHGGIVSTAGDLEAARRFEADARGHLHRALNRNDNGVR